MRMDIRFLVSSVVLLVQMAGAFAVGNTSVKCIESERLSLLSLKQGFVDPYGIISSWSDAENQTECCNWDGVQCDDQTGHVVELNLHDLEGTITPSLAKLHQLNYLDLSYNNFNLTQFPSFIFSLKKLEHLDLSYINLKGKIPYQWGDLFLLQELYLAGNQLEGGIPKSLPLCNLKVLDLSSNSLSGQFVALFRRCAHISLRLLDLSNNRFSGPLPKFSRFLYLEKLYLDYNQLNGTLSESIGLLSNLSELSIPYNSLQGVITETHFLRLSQLQRLDLSFNHFVFQINPDWIPTFQLSSIFLASCKLGPGFPMWLQTQKSSCSNLDISSNEISGTIPSWFWDFQFSFLNLSTNQFIGQIPNFQYNDYMTYMDFSSNLFEGSIPSNLSYTGSTLHLANNKFTNASSLLCPTSTTILSNLDLSNNQLSGVLPDCWKYFESLIYLSVANNSLFGEIPSSMGSLGKIQALHLGNNRFRGEIPMVLSKCKELSTFDVAKNNLSGVIPSWIGDQLKGLRILSLRSNMFFGSLPPNICHLSQVQILDLSMNNISGSLPKCLNHLFALANKTNSDVAISYDLPQRGIDTPDLHSLHVTESSIIVWKGKEASYQSTLGLVKSIDFSSNMLIGEIPNEMMDLVGLVSLNISRNMISGQIPSAIRQLKSLDFLDLSRNHLFGNIPSDISQLDRLSVMDLSYNDLLGEIPHGTQLQSFDPSVYEGNVGLCGAPLPKCPTKPTEGNQDDENPKDDGHFFNRGFYISLSLGFSIGFWGVCSSLFLNKSWRYAYFKQMNDAYDKVYVVVAIKMAKLRRRNIST